MKIAEVSQCKLSEKSRFVIGGFLLGIGASLFVGAILFLCFWHA
jgi:hypothetical protein